MSTEHGKPLDPCLNYYLFLLLFPFFLIASVDLLLLKLQEFCVKKRDRMEVVCMIGVFGFLVSVCQMYPFCQTMHTRQ